MTKAELARFLDETNMSASAFASQIGVHRNTVASWLRPSGPKVPVVVGYACAAIWRRLKPWPED